MSPAPCRGESTAPSCPRTPPNSPVKAAPEPCTGSRGRSASSPLGAAHEESAWLRGTALPLHHTAPGEGSRFNYGAIMLPGGCVRREVAGASRVAVGSRGAGGTATLLAFGKRRHRAEVWSVWCWGRQPQSCRNTKCSPSACSAANTALLRALPSAGHSRARGRLLEECWHLGRSGGTPRATHRGWGCRGCRGRQIPARQPISLGQRDKRAAKGLRARRAPGEGAAAPWFISGHRCPYSLG